MANPLIDRAIAFGKNAVDGVGNFAKRVANTTVGDVVSSAPRVLARTIPGGAVGEMAYNKFKKSTTSAQPTAGNTTGAAAQGITNRTITKPNLTTQMQANELNPGAVRPKSTYEQVRGMSEKPVDRMSERIR